MTTTWPDGTLLWRCPNGCIGLTDIQSKPGDPYPECSTCGAALTPLVVRNVPCRACGQLMIVSESGVAEWEPGDPAEEWQAPCEEICPHCGKPSGNYNTDVINPVRSVTSSV